MFDEKQRCTIEQEKLHGSKRYGRSAITRGASVEGKTDKISRFCQEQFRRFVCNE